MRWLFSKNISTTHGFSTRHGGISTGKFASLNLGGKDDLPENIFANRKRALDDLKIDFSEVAYLNQIHGNTVCNAVKGLQTGDALVTKSRNLALAVGAADCYPVLFYDDKNFVIGASHCGWKGTLNKIVEHTINKMVLLGAEKSTIKIAIGQGISMKNYEVSADLISQFLAAGFPDNCVDGGTLNLMEANKFIALQSGIAEKNIWCMNRCTTETDFFSYRRDNGVTGRMWAVIMMK